jgi:hypothetical protein
MLALDKFKLGIMFLRLIGIPMGTKGAALIADLFYIAISTY